MNKKEVQHYLKLLLKNVDLFCAVASRLKLREYQKDVAKTVIGSVLEHKGLSIVVMFPRQSGKNELQAQIETYLLAVLFTQHAEMVKISPTWSPQSSNAMRRLEKVLNGNLITKRFAAFCGNWRSFAA